MKAAPPAFLQDEKECTITNMQSSGYKYTSFLIIPFSFTCGLGELHKVEKALEKTAGWKYQEVESYMIYSYLNQLFDNKTPSRIGTHYFISKKDLLIKANIAPILAVGKKERTKDDIVHNSMFSLGDSDLYLFNSGVGFLVLRVEYDDVLTLSDIWQTRFELVEYWQQKQSGEWLNFDMRKVINGLLDFAVCDLFFATKTSTSMTDAFGVSITQETELIDRQVAERKAMHLLYAMPDVESNVDKTFPYELYYSEPSVAYCVSIRGIGFTRIRYNEPTACKGDYEQKVYIPLVILALYQKYACLYFTELLGTRRSRKEFDKLRKMIASFKSYGIVSMVSQRLISSTLYKYILNTQNMADVMTEVNNKLTVLIEKSQEETNMKMTVLGTIVSAMGAISVITDGASIIKLLLQGDRVDGFSIGIMTVIGIMLLFLGGLIIAFKSSLNKR